MPFVFYNFRTGAPVDLSHEEMRALMHDQSLETIMVYLPPNPVYHMLFCCRLFQGMSRAEALGDVLQTYLLAGGLTKQLFPRGSLGSV